MPKSKQQRRYHGWILRESGGSGYKDFIRVEWQDEKGNRHTFNGGDDEWRGESGAARAVEWWDKRVGQPIKLQPMLVGSYRVYTEE